MGIAIYATSTCLVGRLGVFAAGAVKEFKKCLRYEAQLQIPSQCLTEHTREAINQGRYMLEYVAHYESGVASRLKMSMTAISAGGTFCCLMAARREPCCVLPELLSDGPDPLFVTPFVASLL